MNGPALYSESVQWLKRALNIHRQDLGEEHPDTLASMENLASILMNQANLKGARMLQEKALEGRTRVLGEEHSSTNTTAWNLFNTLDQQKEYKAAQALLNTHLLWLLEHDPTTLNADQQKIRENLAARVQQPGNKPTNNTP
ncbi:MAG: tetratricopeptide repeat protein [Desulfobulbus sp.]|nr:tetratricopeptide repeat protein [Desulfobulbus sp.]